MLSLELPPRPLMPPSEAARMQHQAARLDILREEHEELAVEWMEGAIDKDRLDNWGPPDLSVNPLADIARQLATPGLYGVTPTIRHTEPTAEVLLEAMQRAGYWTRMQVVQYLAIGAGDYIVGLDAEGGELQVQLVDPCNVWTSGAPRSPTDWLVYRELQVVWSPLSEQWIYVWLQFDRRNPERPTRKYISVHTDPSEELDLTGQLQPAWLEEEYPWRHPRTGRPLIPRVLYRETDSGRAWNHHEKRGIVRGTLNSVLNWSSANNAAVDASGQMVLLAGLDPIVKQVSTPAEEGRQVLSVSVTPGAMLYHRIMDGQQPWAKEVGPGANLPHLLEYATAYEARQQARWGLGKTEQRATSNPWSGAALYISAAEKREHARRIAPVFRRADLEAITLASVLLHSQGIETPAEGYSIVYHEVPRSPEEERAEREEQEWGLQRGLVSSVDLYMARHPGLSREQAIAELTRIRAEQLVIEQRATALAATTPDPLPD